MTSLQKSLNSNLPKQEGTIKKKKRNLEEKYA